MGICRRLVAERGPHQTLTKASHDDPTLGLFNRHPLSLRDRRRWMDRLTKNSLPPVESCAWIVANLAEYNLWKTFQLCDACRIAPARIDSKSEFFLCDGCEAIVVIEFEEFELPIEAPRRATIGTTNGAPEFWYWPN